MSAINSVIARVDAVKLNTYTAEEKARWLIELEGRIYREIMRCFGDYPASEYPADGDDDLLVSSPYDVLYDYYLFAMIDFHNREIESYNSSYAMFNDKYNDFAKAWQRAHRPPGSGGFDVMGIHQPPCGDSPGEGDAIDEKINNHDNDEGSHPFLINVIRQRYDALTALLEQYRTIVDGAATDEDISAAVSAHQNSMFAHQSLFDNVVGKIDATMLSHDEGESSHYALFKAMKDEIAGKADRDEVGEISYNIFVSSMDHQELLGDVRILQEQTEAHAADSANPHNVTAEQIGALTSDSLNDEMGKYIPQLENDIGALQEDKADKVDTYTKAEVDSEVEALLTYIDNNRASNEEMYVSKEEYAADMGDIETALDGILALQESYIGGEGA